MDDQKKIKHIARTFLFSKSFLKREDIYNTAQIQDPPSKRELLLESASKLLQDVFGLSITDTSKIPSSAIPSSEASIISSESTNSSTASRKALMQKNLQSTANKRYILINVLEKRKILHSPKISPITQFYIKEAHKFLILSVISLSSFSISLSSLSESLAALGISRIEEAFLDELIRQKYVTQTKFENDQGNADSIIEWGQRAFLEYSQESILRITEDFCNRS